jgi:hypothetical protein
VIFSTPIIIDCYRAGGEPVIAATASGVLIVAAHPGYTHLHPVEPQAPSSAEPCALEPGAAKIAASTNGQSHLWRSTDGGATWHPISLAEAVAQTVGVDLPNLPNEGPRNAAVGVSDPDLAIDGNGRVWFVEIPAPVGPGPSVSWSDDEGLTWIPGRPHAALGFDRPWIAAHDSTMYLTGATTNIYSTQDGLSYAVAGTKPGGCNGDIVANPLNGALYVPCGNGLAVSDDGGASWRKVSLPLDPQIVAAPEVAIDAAGNLWRAGASATSPLAFATSPNDGADWTIRDVDIPAVFPRLADGLAGGALRWIQTEAGSEGRAAAVFLASPLAARAAEQEWRVYAVLSLEGHILGAELTPDPVHTGPMCVSSAATNCLWNQFGCSTSACPYDRRMGDLFEATVDRDGFLHVVYSNTHADPDDWVSHVGYVRLLEGASLVEGVIPEGFPTQG